MSTTALATGCQCPVAIIAREVETVLDALDAIKPPESPIDKLERERRESRLQDRKDALVVQSSYLLAQSPEGALFHLMIAHAWADLIFASDTDDYQSKQDEGVVNRCLMSAMRYIEKSAKPLPRCRDHFANPKFDPHTLLAADIVAA
jgi:hypothetical protein